jgi:predicted nucleic acid-binding protein
MAVKVVDASAIAAFLFDEPQSEAVKNRLFDASLAAPALRHFELANVCWKMSLRHPAKRGAILAAFARRGRLGVREAPVDQDGAVQLALATGLTTHDASYLWLARHLGAELITLDRRLAAASVGVRT